MVQFKIRKEDEESKVRFKQRNEDEKAVGRFKQRNMKIYEAIGSVRPNAAGVIRFDSKKEI